MFEIFRPKDRTKEPANQNHEVSKEEFEPKSSEKESLAGRAKVIIESIRSVQENLFKSARSKKAIKMATALSFATFLAVSSGCAIGQGGRGGYSLEELTSPSRVPSRVYIDAYKNEKRRQIDEEVWRYNNGKMKEGEAAAYEDINKGNLRYYPDCRGNAELICGPWCVGYERIACDYISQEKSRNIRDAIDRGRLDAGRDYRNQKLRK